MQTDLSMPRRAAGASRVTEVPNLVGNPRKSERNAMLSLLGDGVVPTQGAAALRFLLDHLAALAR